MVCMAWLNPTALFCWTFLHNLAFTHTPPPPSLQQLHVSWTISTAINKPGEWLSRCQQCVIPAGLLGHKYASEADLCGGRCFGWQVSTVKKAFQPFWCGAPTCSGNAPASNTGECFLKRKQAIRPHSPERKRRHCEHARACVENSCYIIIIQSLTTAIKAFLQE